MGVYSMLAKTTNTNFLKFIIVLIAFQDVAAGVAGSIMAQLIEAFPDYSPTVVMMIATIPGFLQIFPALFYGKLANKFSTRGLLFTGLGLFIIGGVMPFFLDNLFAIIFFRGLLGLGVGITMPLSIDVVGKFFKGKEKDTIIGLGTSTVACIGAIFFQVVGGMLADSYGWHYGFLVYLLPLIILALTFLYLPEPARQKTPNASFKEIWFSAPKTVYGLSLGQIAFTALVFGYVTNISIIIQSEQLGSATEAGMAISFFTFGTLIVGFFFGMIRHWMPTLNIPLGVFFTAVGILWCSFASNLSLIYLASFIGGMGMGLVIPGVLTRIGELSNEKKGISFVGFGVAAQGVGGIISPITFVVLLGIFGLEGSRSTLMISGIGLVVVSIAWLAISVLVKTKVPTIDVDPTNQSDIVQ